MEHIIYLDNSATTKPCESAKKYINDALCSDWGNPSSLHTLGINSEMKISEARAFLSNKLSAKEDEIIFTGSGSEANNTAIFSARALKRIGNKIITSKIEHPSVLEAVKVLESEGFNVARISCDENGIIDLEELKSELDDKTILVSIMLVNNEIGSIQPIKEAVALTREKAPNALFHCDAVQAFGKMPINVRSLGVDFMSISAHKIHGPKGIGALYLKNKTKFLPLVYGGGQESGRRSGTEPTPLIAGFFGALKELDDSSAEKVKSLNEFARKAFEECSFIEINSPKNALPFILNISVPGFRSETLLHFLDSKGIIVSSGSACAKGAESYVLKALGLDRKRQDSALRLSFSRYNKEEDIVKLLSALEEATKKLRRSNI